MPWSKESVLELTQCVSSGCFRGSPRASPRSAYPSLRAKSQSSSLLSAEPVMARPLWESREPPTRGPSPDGPGPGLRDSRKELYLLSLRSRRTDVWGS